MYNRNGSLIYDETRGIVNIRYDNNNNPVWIQFDNGNVNHGVGETDHSLRPHVLWTTMPDSFSPASFLFVTP